MEAEEEHWFDQDDEDEEDEDDHDHLFSHQSSSSLLNGSTGSIVGDTSNTLSTDPLNNTNPITNGLANISSYNLHCVISTTTPDLLGVETSTNLNSNLIRTGSTLSSSSTYMSLASATSFNSSLDSCASVLSHSSSFGLTDPLCSSVSNPSSFITERFRTRTLSGSSSSSDEDNDDHYERHGLSSLCRPNLATRLNHPITIHIKSPFANRNHLETTSLMNNNRTVVNHDDEDDDAEEVEELACVNSESKENQAILCRVGGKHSSQDDLALRSSPSKRLKKVRTSSGDSIQALNVSSEVGKMFLNF